LYGKFAWPQITNVHRIEGGGTEFPMMIMDGSAGLGLIVHELGHNYTMGILANNEWREGYLDEGFTSFQTSWFFENHGGQSEYPAVEGDILLWDIDRWSQPVSMISERYRDFTTYNTMIYDKGQLFYEQLRYVVGDDAMREILRTYYARWRLKHVDENAFRTIAEEVSHQDLKWLFGQWLHGTPLIDYRLDDVERHRLADGRWRTTLTVTRLGDGWMPIEIGDADTIYARASGQAERERVEFVTSRKPKRLVLDPRQRAHDWNALNNWEKKGLWPATSRGKGVARFDNPTRTESRRDRVVTAFLPLAWSNDPHAGFDAIWMAVSDIGYVDRRLWDNAGTVEAGPWGSLTSQHGERVWRARGSIRGGLVYKNPGPGQQLSSRYDVEGFARATAEASVRTPFVFKTTLGARVFGGAYLTQDAPALQRRIMLAGADPYETFTNPLLRSRGALLVRPDFHYHAPGDANLRAFRPDLGGRWAVALNIEGSKRLGGGLFADASVAAFVDAGLVDPTTVPSSPSGKSFTTLYDGGVGLVLRPHINELAWTKIGRAHV